MSWRRRGSGWGRDSVVAAPLWFAIVGIGFVGRTSGRFRNGFIDAVGLLGSFSGAWRFAYASDARQIARCGRMVRTVYVKGFNR